MRMTRFKMWHWKHRQRWAVKCLRASLLFFGYDLEEFSDEELWRMFLESTEKLGKAVTRVGIAASQATKGLQKLSISWRG